MRERVTGMSWVCLDTIVATVAIWAAMPLFDVIRGAIIAFFTGA